MTTNSAFTSIQGSNQMIEIRITTLEIINLSYIIIMITFFVKWLINGKVFAAGIYLLKVNNRNTRTKCEICSKLFAEQINGLVTSF